MPAPTINNPLSGEVYSTGSTVPVRWTHNGNLTQSGAQVELTKPDSSTATATVSGATSVYPYSTTGWASGQYSVRVRTKQGTSSYDDWSPARSFNVYAAPTVSVEYPFAYDGGTVSNLPLQIGFTYSDSDGSLAFAAFELYDDASGERVYSSPDIPASEWTESGGTYYLYVAKSDFLPENNAEYDLAVFAQSTTGLGTWANRTFKTQWSVPSQPSISATEGADASVDIAYGWTAGGTPVDSVYLYRIDADGETLLESHEGTSGTVSYTYTDRLPLLDYATTYKAVAFAASGAYSVNTASVTVKSGGLCYFNWDGGVAAFDMDLAWSSAIEPKRALFEVIGRRDPVLRTTNRRTKTLTASGTVWWDDDAPFERLQDMPGRVWFREPRGHRIPVAVNVNLSYPKGTPVTGLSISMTQVSEV